MLGKRHDQELILAEHGRRISQFRDEVQLSRQRLKMLESRISAFESHFIQLTKICNKLDVQISSMEDMLSRLNTQVEALKRSRVKGHPH